MFKSYLNWETYVEIISVLRNSLIIHSCSCYLLQTWQINSLTHWSVEDVAVDFLSATSKLIVHSLLNSSRVNTTEPQTWNINIGSGNGLVSSGTQIYFDSDLCPNMASLGHNELKDRVISDGIIRIIRVSVQLITIAISVCVSGYYFVIRGIDTTVFYCDWVCHVYIWMDIVDCSELINAV